MYYRITFLLILSLFVGRATAQQTVETYDIPSLVDDYLDFSEVEVELKYKDPANGSVHYQLTGLENQFEIFKDMKSNFSVFLSPFQDKSNSQFWILISTEFRLKEELNISQRLEFINEWAHPSYASAIFWNEDEKKFTLYSSDTFSTKQTTYERLNDLFMGFIISYYKLQTSSELQ